MMDHLGNVREANPRAPISLCHLNSTRADATSQELERHSSSELAVSAIATTAKRRLDAATLAQRWGIGLDAARRTLNRTTQRGTRSVLHPSLSRRFRTNDRQLRYRRLPIELFADTMFSKTKSRRGNTCAEIYCARNGWKRAHPMKSKGDTHHTLSDLFATDGVPAAIIVDGSKEQTQGKFREVTRDAHCHVRVTEPYSPWQNAAESAIRELKKGTGRKMIKSACPKRLWDDCLELEALIQSSTASNVFGSDGEAPDTVVSGETTDISQLCEHAWYDWILFRDTVAPFPNDQLVLGRYLGPSKNIGPAMTAKILKANGEVVHRTTYRALTPEERASPTENAKREDFVRTVNEALGPKMDMGDLPAEDAETPEYDLYEDDDGEAHHDVEEDITPEEGDTYINSEVMLPQGSELVSATVRRRKRDVDGNLRGTQNPNPILDTRVYEVQFPDGRTAEYSANVIAENIWSQTDLDGNQHLLIDEIVDYRKSGHALTPANRWVYKRGRKHTKRSMKGWQLCVKWKDGSTTWEKLSNIRDSFPTVLKLRGMQSHKELTTSPLLTGGCRKPSNDEIVLLPRSTNGITK